MTDWIIALFRFPCSDGTLRTPPKGARRDPNESLEMLQPPKSAMNDTGKIQKTRQRVPRPEPALNTSNLSLGELRKVGTSRD